MFHVVYVLPQWEALAAWLLAFAGMFNIHMNAQSLVFKVEGALGVALVNAVRGAAVTVIAGGVFCSPTKPMLCLTRQSGAAAELNALGGVVWVLSGARAKAKTKREARPDAGAAAAPLEDEKK